MTHKSNSKQVLSICDEALQQAESERDLFLKQACQGDHELRASVDSVLIAISDAGDFLDHDLNQETESSLIGQQIGKYRLVEKLGEGGMGSVFLGQRDDDEIKQKVAIKLIKSHMLAREIVERFHAERKILAALNHPYIAGLIDSGTSRDGIPYLVMEYINGLPIDHYCNTKGLSLAQRIRLVQKVAMAVHTAHQNLVVHRDLKPSNVLVTTDGIPKLLDFGIAKLITDEGNSSGSNTTVFGRQAMTPNYASPEQVLEGKVTTASDVYSLGVLTYQLLSGERPYHIKTSTHRELVQSFESLFIPKPSERLNTLSNPERIDHIASDRSTTPAKLRKTLSGDLDNILAKALHPDPTRRYSSVADFSADLDRYLNKLPVEARGDSVSYRIGRFISRHRFGVAAALGGVTLLFAGLGATSWAYIKAESARAEADQLFSQVRNIAATMMFDAYDEVSKLRGSTRAREVLATSAQQYLDSLAASDRSSPDVLFDASKGYDRLAKVLGGVDDLTLGDRPTAAQNYDKAESILTSLHDNYPDNQEYALTLAELQRDLAAHALYGDNNIELAREQALKSIETYSNIRPRTNEVVVGLVGAMIEHADTFDWDGKPDEAKSILLDALTLVGTIDSNADTNWKAASARGKVLRDLGDAEYYLDDLESSLGHLRESVTIMRSVVDYTDNVPVANRGLAITLFTLAGSEVDANEKQAALATIDEAVALAKKQIDADSNDAGAIQLYSAVIEQRSTILSELGRFDEAIKQAMESYQLQVEQGTTGDAMADRELTVDIYNVGLVYLKADRKEPACEWLTRAADRLLSLRASGEITGYDDTELLPTIQGYQTTACDD